MTLSKILEVGEEYLVSKFLRLELLITESDYPIQFNTYYLISFICLCYALIPWYYEVIPSWIITKPSQRSFIIHLRQTTKPLLQTASFYVHSYFDFFSI